MEETLPRALGSNIILDRKLAIKEEFYPPNKEMVEGESKPGEMSLGSDGIISTTDEDGNIKQQATIDAVFLKTSITAIRGFVGKLKSDYFKTTDILGDWYYDPLDATSTDNTGTVLVTADGKRIKRFITGPIDATWFQAVGDYIPSTGVGTDNTNSIKLLMDYARSNKVKKVIFQAGRYAARYVDFYNISIEGIGGVDFYALTSSEPSFFRLKELGPIVGREWNNFNIRGNPLNIGQHGFNATAIPQTIPAYTGGIWFSRFNNVEITGFDGLTMNFECIDPKINNVQYDMAHQFLTFNNVRLIRGSGLNSRAFKALGQFGQIQFNNCQFDGSSLLQNTINVELVSSLVTTNNTDEIYSVDFNTCTFQVGDKGLRTYYAKGINLNGCHFEQLTRPVYAETGSHITIRGSHYGVCGQASINPDFTAVACLAYSGSTSFIHFDDNYSFGQDNVMVAEPGSGHVSYGTGNTISSPKFSNTTLQVSVGASGTLSAAGAKGRIYINAGTNELHTVTGYGGIADELMIQLLGDLTINQTGNIRGLGAFTSFTFRSGLLVHLKYNGEHWIILNKLESIVTSGNVSPEGAVNAIKGAIYQRKGGLATQSLYVKTIEDTGSNNTGWETLELSSVVDAKLLNKVSKNPTTQQSSITSSNTLDTGANSDYLLNANNRTLLTITSALTGGDVIRLRCWAGSDIPKNPYIAIGSGGNIDLGGFGRDGKIILRDRDAVTLTRNTIGSTWIVTSAPVLKSRVALPISGYYFLGEKIDKAYPTIGSNAQWLVTTEGYAGANYAAAGGYVIGNSVIVGGNAYEATTNGTVANNPPSGTGTTVDGTVTWQYKGVAVIFSSVGIIADEITFSNEGFII